VIGFLKGKSALAIARLYGKERNFSGEHFWARRRNKQRLFKINQFASDERKNKDLSNQELWTRGHAQSCRQRTVRRRARSA
jgi:hypothetical protein